MIVGHVTDRAERTLLVGTAGETTPSGITDFTRSTLSGIFTWVLTALTGAESITQTIKVPAADLGLQAAA